MKVDFSIHATPGLRCSVFDSQGTRWAVIHEETTPTYALGNLRIFLETDEQVAAFRALSEALERKAEPVMKEAA